MSLYSWSVSEERFYHTMQWKKRFVIWPRYCRLSKRKLWLEFAWYGSKENYYKPETWYAWHSIEDHLIWQLKGNNK